MTESTPPNRRPSFPCNPEIIISSTAQPNPATRTSFSFNPEFCKLSPLATRMRSASVTSVTSDDGDAGGPMTAEFFARRQSFAQGRFQRAPSVDEERILKGEFSF